MMEMRADDTPGMILIDFRPMTREDEMTEAEKVATNLLQDLTRGSDTMIVIETTILTQVGAGQGTQGEKRGIDIESLKTEMTYHTQRPRNQDNPQKDESLVK
jgi:hypothetical protein